MSNIEHSENPSTTLYLNDAQLQTQTGAVNGDFVTLLGESYYRIRNYDRMPAFFMSLVSSSDHWMFISSTGGLTAGRIDPESTIFPYDTDDKIAAGSEHTGPITLIQVFSGQRRQLWTPFSDRYAGLYHCERNLYKNVAGNKLLFEEINHDLELRYTYTWRTGDRFGFAKSSRLHNLGAETRRVELLDGLQNLMPYGATEQLQTQFSNLLNGYKRNEIEPSTGLGIFALSATLTDQAEPSESLKASVAWQLGLDGVQHLLCTDQIAAFRSGLPITPEYDMRGKAGAYLINAGLTLASGESRQWHIVADVNQESHDMVHLVGLLGGDRTELERQLKADIEQGTRELVDYVASADGLEVSAQPVITTHHFANTLFNIMRGGIFVDGYHVDRDDLLDFMRVRNRVVLEENAGWFDALPERVTIADLYARAAATDAADLVRLCYEYLPLTFSRRHGDPSRPWNRFSINLRQPDGSPRLDYQGNWRDIFQNWEPLLVAFPDYVQGIIAKFLNATTADGYNPYRVTRDGIEWEVPEPDNPWANIGYWSDHQIIYLQKLLEIAEEMHPGSLQALWNRSIYAYADVPYRLRPYDEMLADWYNTIDFDWASEAATEAAVATLGTDGRLCRDGSGAVIHVTMVEKLLVLLLAKLTNLAPEGGIWMNTQRPEWNDANNALVGKGLSVVTAAYLRRFISFLQSQLALAEGEIFIINGDLATLLGAVQSILSDNRAHLDTGFNDQNRRSFMDSLGGVASAYRSGIYSDGLPSARVELTLQALDEFLALAQAYVEQTLRANRREDGLYHAYNILHPQKSGMGVDHLYPMLEGQVAILSSGLLTPAEALELLASLRSSDLYRADQHTYMLYPNRDLPGFLRKNNVDAEDVGDSALVAALTMADDRRLLLQDVAGVYHFNGGFRNAGDVARVLTELAQEPAYTDLIVAERDFILELFETTFNHRAFTGRSGTFFAFEGLGSIYWHMVAKLLLAVQECYFAARVNGADTATVAGLAAAYYDIRQGLGFNKSPVEYGAFPTDPYSHTPMGGGARQPGMTGQVKEELLTRQGELGVSVRQGALHFEPTLLRREEFLVAPDTFTYVDVDGERRRLTLPANSLAFTFCQTPIIYTLGESPKIDVTYADGRSESTVGMSLDITTARHMLARDSYVRALHVTVFLAL